MYFHQLSFSRHRSFQSFLSSVLCGLVHCRLEHLFPISFPFPLSHIHQGTEQGNQTGESVQAILHHTEGHSRASPQIFKWGGGGYEGNQLWNKILLSGGWGWKVRQFQPHHSLMQVIPKLPALQFALFAIAHRQCAQLKTNSHYLVGGRKAGRPVSIAAHPLSKTEQAHSSSAPFHSWFL